MPAASSIRATFRGFSRYLTQRDFLFGSCLVGNHVSSPSLLQQATTFAELPSGGTLMDERSYSALCQSLYSIMLMNKLSSSDSDNITKHWLQPRHMSNTAVALKTDSDVVRFSIGKSNDDRGSSRKAKKMKRVKMSRKAKVNELRFYRLKAKKKMKSPNPEVRIRQKEKKPG